MYSIRQYSRHTITVIALFSGLQIYLTLEEVFVMWKQKYQSVHIVYFSDKKHWELLLHYLQILFMVYYLWCVYFFCCNKKTSQHIPSVIIYFFSTLDFNFSENNMLQKLKYLVLHKLLFWNPASSWKTENFENVSTS